jgi:hypothetical protein
MSPRTGRSRKNGKKIEKRKEEERRRTTIGLIKY